MNVRLLFALNAILLVLLMMSAPFIEPGTGTFVVAVISLVLILTSMIGLGAIMWYSQRKVNELPPN